MAYTGALLKCLLAFPYFATGLKPGLISQPLVQKAMVATYSRVRLQNVDELDKSYNLLVGHLQSSSVAPSVEEFVLDILVQNIGCSCSFGEAEKEQITWFKNDTEDQALLRAVKALGLQEKSENEITQALSWKKQQLSVDRGGSPDGRRYVSKKEAEYAQYVTPLLFSIFPNVQRFKATETSRVLNEYLLRANYGLLPTPQLQNLRHVRYVLKENVDMHDERFYTRFDILGALKLFHRLPRFESFSVSGITDEENGIDILPPHLSNLKRVTITHSQVSSGHLATIIRLPKALEEFTASTGGRGLWDGGYLGTTPKTLGKALLSQKASLKKLDLDLDDTYSVWGSVECGAEAEDDDDEYHPADGTDPLELRLSWQRDKYFDLDEAASPGPLLTRDLPNTRCYGRTIGSLHDFGALTHLAIGVKLLLGEEGKAPFRLVDALPASLETLVIRGFGPQATPEHADQIRELMLLRVEKLPNLREVRGVEVEIPSAKIVYDEELESDMLWVEPEEDDGWLEA